MCIYRSCSCLHRVAEFVRISYADVDTLVANAKRCFLKSPERTRLFKKANPSVPLPPKPIITRWGTWLRAVDYFHEHYDEFAKGIMNLEPDDSAAIERIQDILKKPHLKTQIAAIHANFSTIAEAITKLETEGLPLTESIDTVLRVGQQLSSLLGPVGREVYQKYNAVLSRNPGFQVMCQIADVFRDQDPDQSIRHMNPRDLSKFKYVPITSCDVERCFSQYAAVFTANRRSFKFENLSHIFTILCNHFMSTISESPNKQGNFTLPEQGEGFIPENLYMFDLPEQHDAFSGEFLMEGPSSTQTR